MQTAAAYGRFAKAKPALIEHENDLSNYSSWVLRDCHSEIECDTDPMDVVKVIFLGARGVGKTSIIRQFVWNHFGDEHGPTETKRVYYSSAIFDDRVYQLRIADVPSISHFPVDSYVEWSDFRCYGLRNANAYILVFDLSDLESFRYIRVLRDQIAESRDIRDVPILVVGNKHDSVARTLRRTHSAYPAGNSHPMTNKRGEAYKEKLKEIVALIRKQWKCSYVDCSAKYNWKVVAVFEEVIKIVDGVRPRSATLGHREVASLVVENAHVARGTKCVVS